VAYAAGHGCVDQRNFIGDLPGGRAVGEEQTVNSAQRVVQSRSRIEVHGRKRNSGRQTSSIRRAGQCHNLNRFREQFRNQGGAHATCGSSNGNARAAGATLGGVEHPDNLPYLGTISPRYVERSFHDVKWEWHEWKTPIR